MVVEPRCAVQCNRMEKGMLNTDAGDSEINLSVVPVYKGILKREEK